MLNNYVILCYVFNTAAGNLQHYLNLHWLKVRQGWDFRFILCLSCECTQPYQFAYPSKSPGKKKRQSFSKTPWISCSQIFLFKYLEGLLDAPTNIIALGDCTVEQLQLVFFKKHPGIGIFPWSKLWTRSNNKNTLWMGLLQGAGKQVKLWQCSGDRSFQEH